MMIYIKKEFLGGSDDGRFQETNQYLLIHVFLFFFFFVGWLMMDRPDPRKSVGKCEKKADELRSSLTSHPWSGTLQPWQVGGSGAGTIKKEDLESIGPFPPDSISGSGKDGSGTLISSQLPQLLPTGPIITLPSSSPLIVGGKTYPATKGWSQANDTVGYYAPVEGCHYLDLWNSSGLASPGPCQIQNSGISTTVKSNSGKPK